MLWDHDVNVTQVFGTVIRHHGVDMLLFWGGWSEIYHLLRRKAVAYKRIYLSQRNRAAGLYTPWVQQLLEEDCERVLTLLDQVINSQLVLKYDRMYRHHSNPLQKNSKVWTPILKSLQLHLNPHFSSKRHWEYAGGSVGKPVTPKEVYEVINKTLHFCYPSIWPYNSNTTLSIKTRCQR